MRNFKVNLSWNLTEILPPADKDKDGGSAREVVLLGDHAAMEFSDLILWKELAANATCFAGQFGRIVVRLIQTALDPACSPASATPAMATDDRLPPSIQDSAEPICEPRDNPAGSGEPGPVVP